MRSLVVALRHLVWHFATWHRQAIWFVAWLWRLSSTSERAVVEQVVDGFSTPFLVAWGYNSSMGPHALWQWRR